MIYGIKVSFKMLWQDRKAISTHGKFQATKKGREFQQATRETPETSKQLEGRCSLAREILITVVKGPEKDLGLDSLGQGKPRLIKY